MADTWTPRPGRRAIYKPQREPCMIRILFPASNGFPARAWVNRRDGSTETVLLSDLTPPPEHRMAEAARNVAKWREAATYAEPGSDARNRSEAQLDYAIDALEVALEEYDA